MKKILIFLLTLVMVVSIPLQALADENTNTSIQQPKIYGTSAITIDMKTGEIIYAKDIDKRAYPASTTKLMTALLLAENKKKSDLLTYSQEAKNQPEYSLNLNVHAIAVGEKMTAANAMDGLLLFSGNDVAYMIASSVGGNVKSFINMMNDRAEKLNLKNTHFVTPNGLHDDEHYTTAYDLSVIAREAFKNPWVKESMGKEKSTIKTVTGPNMSVENRNKLLNKDGCIGGKTGYTSEAGRCLVAIYERNGRQIMGVVMKSVYDKEDKTVFEDMKKIIDYSYSAKQTTLISKDTNLRTETIDYKIFGFFGPVKQLKVPVTIKDNVAYYENQLNTKESMPKLASYKMNNFTLNDLKKGNSIGTLTINERGVNKNFKLYSSLTSKDINKILIPSYFGFAAVCLGVIILILFTIRTVNLNKRNRKRKNRYR